MSNYITASVKQHASNYTFHRLFPRAIKSRNAEPWL